MQALFLIALISSAIAAPSQQLPLQNAKLCNPAKEYVATLEYLREQKELDLKESEAQKLADKVSMGCTGAFNRFAKVAKSLLAVGIDSATTLGHAVEYATSNDEKAKAFLELFHQTYASEKLDLDAVTSLRISLELSDALAESGKNMLDDFKRLVNYCMGEKNLGLPSNLCAEMATKVTKLGGKFSKKMAPSYINLVQFISEDNKGPQMDKTQAISIADEVITSGPTAADNFINAYKYGVSKKGLALAGKDAISFANKMAKRSYQLPASL